MIFVQSSGIYVCDVTVKQLATQLNFEQNVTTSSKILSIIGQEKKKCWKEKLCEKKQNRLIPNGTQQTLISNLPIGLVLSGVYVGARSASHTRRPREAWRSQRHFTEYQTHMYTSRLVPSIGPIVSAVTSHGRQNLLQKSRPVS